MVVFNLVQANLQQQLMQAQTISQQQAILSQYQNQMAAQGTATSLYNPMTSTSATGTTWTTVSSTTATTITNAMAHALYSSQHLANHHNAPLVQAARRLLGDCSIEDGEPCRITLPDGGVLEVMADGSYVLNDTNAKVVYRANHVRDFNPFLNASDKIEDFITFCGKHGVRQSEMLQLPLKLFIAWLVIEAAKADHEPEPNIPLIPQIKQRTECRCRCGRFVSRAVRDGQKFCRVQCFEAEARRIANRHAA